MHKLLDRYCSYLKSLKGNILQISITFTKLILNQGTDVRLRLKTYYYLLIKYIIKFAYGKPKLDNIFVLNSQ
jgi:hypothetical protein